MSRRCQIHAGDTGLGYEYQPCGKPASWWSDDVSRDGSTVWMCDRHQREVARSMDDTATFCTEPDDSAEKRRDFAAEYARDAARGEP